MLVLVLACVDSSPRGFGHLLSCPGDSYQAGQAWPLEDLADVVEHDDQFLEPV